jgi:hypothetical protein
VKHRSIRTTNAIESFFSHVRQRTDQIDAFTTETSCLVIVWAVMQNIHVPRIPVSSAGILIAADQSNQPERVVQREMQLVAVLVTQEPLKELFP